MSHQKYHVPNEPFIENIHFINVCFYWQFIAIFSCSSCHLSVSLNKNSKFTRGLECVDFFAEPIKLFDWIINFRRNRISQKNRKKRTHKHGLHSHQSIKDTSTKSIREIELLSFWIDEIEYVFCCAYACVKFAEVITRTTCCLNGGASTRTTITLDFGF